MVDAVAVDRWFADYLEDFAAVVRGQRGIDRLLERYAVPLILTVEDGAMQLATAQDVLTVIGTQVDQLRAQGFAGSVEVHGETTVLNASSAVRGEGIARRRADDSEIDRVEMTYVIIETGDGPRIAVMAVHGSEAEGTVTGQRHTLGLVALRPDQAMADPPRLPTSAGPRSRVQEEVLARKDGSTRVDQRLRFDREDARDRNARRRAPLVGA